MEIKKRVLVTGGAGFIGSNLVKGLVEKDHDVTVIDNLSTGREEKLSDVKDSIKFHKLDITDDILDRIGNISFDCIFHMAANPSVEFSVRRPLEVDMVNSHGTLNMLEYARKSGSKKFVYSASSAAYGETDCSNNTEDMLPLPLSPYGVSKLCGEYYVRCYDSLFDISTICLRYFNVFGEFQDPDSQYAAVIPKFITSALKGEKLTVFGDGKQTRDFTYVKDIVRANLLAMETDINGQSVNVATGGSISLNQLIDAIKKGLNRPLNVVYEDVRDGDIKHSCSDISKALEVLGYRPEFDFEQAIKKTMDWYEEKIL